MADDRDQRGDWVELRGVRLAPIEAVDTVVNGLLYDVFTTIGALIATAVVRGARATHSTPQLDIDRGVIRSGKKSIALADIDRARIMVQDQQLQLGNVDLRFGRPGQLEFAVLLRDEHGVVAPEATRRALAEAFAATSIDIPRDKYDPSGKFARSGAPFNITQDEAIALVLDPSAADGPLPIIR